MNTSNIFDRLSRKIHHHSDMEPHESDSGPPFGEVEPLNFQDDGEEDAPRHHSTAKQSADYYKAHRSGSH